jgi:hypothetical protein
MTFSSIKGAGISCPHMVAKEKTVSSGIPRLELNYEVL